MVISSPVKLSGVTMTPIWSGRNLSSMYERFRGLGLIGELWETSAIPERTAAVLLPDGNMPFDRYLSVTGSNIPPLVKLIDAAAPLSIQVHPDDISAVKYGGISKTEIWYILDAAPSAEILYGTKPGVSRDDVCSAVHDGTIESLLCRVPVQAGDMFMIPSGMIHSLGAGITVLEVQNCAGSTYRLKDIAGNRETHTEEGCDSIRIYSADTASSLAYTDSHKLSICPIPGEILASTEDFAISEFASAENPEFTELPEGGIYMFCRHGSGISGNVEFTAGDSLFFTNSGNTIKLDPHSSIIFVV